MMCVKMLAAGTAVVLGMETGQKRSDLQEANENILVSYEGFSSEEVP